MQRASSVSNLSRAAVIAVFLAVSCAAQTSQGGAQTQGGGAQTPGAEKRQASGERTIIGCLQRGDSGFVIKANDGTYELNTDRDLSAYVGKQVKLSGRWEASGVFSTAPVSGASSPSTAEAPSATAPPAAEPSTGTPAFVGDLHLRITGTVVGDCAAPKP